MRSHHRIGIVIGCVTLFVGVVYAATQFSIGTEQTWTSDAPTEEHIVKMTSSSALIMYRDFSDANEGVGRVMYRDGNTLSVGAKATIDAGSTAAYSIARMSNTGAVVAYSTSVGKAAIARINGTSVVFSTAQQITSASDAPVVAPYGGSGVLIAYRDGADSNRGKVRLAKAGSSALVFDSPTTFETNAADMRGIAQIATDKYVVLYTDGGNSNRGEIVAIDTTGGSITVGTAVALNSSSFLNAGVLSTATNQFVVFYRDLFGSNDGEARLGTVAGTTITFQTAVKFEDSFVQEVAGASYGDGNVVILGYNLTNFNAYLGTIDGTTLSFASPQVYDDSGGSPTITALTTTGAIVVYGTGQTRTIDLVEATDSSSSSGGGAAARARRDQIIEMRENPTYSDVSSPCLVDVGIYDPNLDCGDIVVTDDETDEEPVKAAAPTEEDNEEEVVDEPTDTEVEEPQAYESNFHERVCERVERRFGGNQKMIDRINERLLRRFDIMCEL